MNGLNITRAEFTMMPMKQQNTIIFDNTEEIKRLLNTEQIKLQAHMDKDLFDHRCGCWCIYHLYAFLAHHDEKKKTETIGWL